MNSRSAIIAVLAIATGVFGAGRTAASDESGSFSIIRSFVRDYASFDHAEGQITGGTLKGTVTTLESSGAPFEEGQHSLIMCLVYSKRSVEGIDLQAPCTTTDLSGDRWYTMSRRSAGDVAAGGGGEGRWELMGGTGRYAGVTGSCVYETSYLGENRSVTTGTCSWSRQ